MQTQSDNLMHSLNASQRAAASHIDGPLLVLAGPGSGKTRVLVHRIAHMINSGVPSHQIAALTFTNKAAEEMSDRLSKLVPEHHAWTGTFHRFCSKLMRSYAPMVGLDENFTIYDTSDTRRLLKQVMDASDLDLGHHSVDQIRNQISQAKSEALSPEDYSQRSGNHLQKIAARLYPAYQEELREANAVDFDDLLLCIVQLLRENPQLRQSLDERYRYLLVDEYQDTNACQYLILKGLSQVHSNLAVTGDPDQSIYGWRGASLRNILDFERDYPNVTVLRLEQNYRSTKSILAVADHLILNNLHRKHKQLVSENEQGCPVSLVAYPTQQQEANSIADTIAHQIQSRGRQPNDFAIFYRVNSSSRSFEHALRSCRIPYQVVHGQEFYQRSEIKDMLAYLHLINNPRDNIALQRIINVPSRKIGKVTLGRVRQYAADHKLSMLEAARRAGLIETISKQAAAKVAAFVALYDRLALRHDESVEGLLEYVLSQTGYRDHLLADESEEGDNRLANVDELLTAAREFDLAHPDDGSLEAYLETAVLVNDTDAWEAESNAVTLMTLHAAKGLEFPVVFVVGVEDGTIPHERSMHDDLQIEEERRLLFVGITRAKQELQISRALYRFRRGANWPTVASRFLMELPREQMSVIEPRGVYLPDEDHDSPGDFAQGQFDDEPWFEGVSDEPQASVDAFRQPTKHGQVKTAAQMFSDPELDPESPTTGPDKREPPASPRPDPASFRHGMLVNHPEYGTGQIVAISGQAHKRTATVEFFGGGERTFRLALSPLTPVAS